MEFSTIPDVEDRQMKPQLLENLVYQFLKNKDARTSPRRLSLIVRRLISSGYLFARVSSYFSLYFMTGQFRVFAAVLLTNPEDLNKFIHNPLLVLPLHGSSIYNVSLDRYSCTSNHF